MVGFDSRKRLHDRPRERQIQLLIVTNQTCFALQVKMNLHRNLQREVGVFCFQSHHQYIHE